MNYYTKVDKQAPLPYLAEGLVLSLSHKRRYVRKIDALINNPFYLPKITENKKTPKPSYIKDFSDYCKLLKV